MNKYSGWSWIAFFLGPIWYFNNGLFKKASFLLLVCIFSLFLALPFILIYCGVSARDDLYEFKLKEKSKINISAI